MIIPNFWAEATVQGVNRRNRRVNIQRWGWSNISVADATSHAQQRALTASEDLQRGQTISYRERKHAYDAGTGSPIREEVVQRFEPTVITRNSYGALCLNTPNVMFVDIDDPYLRAPRKLTQPIFMLIWVMLWAASYYGTHHILGSSIVALVITSVVWSLWARQWARKLWLRTQTPPREQSWTAVRRFSDRHPDWHLRVYETPAGLRVLVMHELIAPDSMLAKQAFDEMGADPLYRHLCALQHCYRARVSPKPWRLNQFRAERVVRKVWPVEGEALEQRNTWVRAYEAASSGFAACKFTAQLGSSNCCQEAAQVQDIHDTLCFAQSDKPLA